MSYGKALLKNPLLKKNSFCIVDYCKHTGVGNTINTGFHRGVLRGEMEGVGTSLCFVTRGMGNDETIIEALNHD